MYIHIFKYIYIYSNTYIPAHIFKYTYIPAAKEVCTPN